PRSGSPSSGTFSAGTIDQSVLNSRRNRCPPGPVLSLSRRKSPWQLEGAMYHALPQAKRVVLLVVLFAGAGCNREAAPPAAELPVVTVSKPVSEKVTEYSYDIGRIAAPDSVEVRSRVTGYLDKVFFKEGAEVKKKDPLFEIDQRPYK